MLQKRSISFVVDVSVESVVGRVVGRVVGVRYGRKDVVGSASKCVMSRLGSLSGRSLTVSSSRLGSVTSEIEIW